MYIFFSETAVVDGNLNAVDVCALLLAANQLFKRKKFGKLLMKADSVEILIKAHL